MTKNPYIRALKREKRRIEDNLVAIRATFGDDRIRNDADIREHCRKKLVRLGEIAMSIRCAREADKAAQSIA